MLRWMAFLCCCQHCRKQRNSLHEHLADPVLHYLRGHSVHHCAAVLHQPQDVLGDSGDGLDHHIALLMVLPAGREEGEDLLIQAGVVGHLQTKQDPKELTLCTLAQLQPGGPQTSHRVGPGVTRTPQTL